MHIFIDSLFSHSVISDSFMAPWTVAFQAPLSMGFPRQEYWSGLPFPFPSTVLTLMGSLPSHLTTAFYTTGHSISSLIQVNKIFKDPTVFWCFSCLPYLLFSVFIVGFFSALPLLQLASPKGSVLGHLLLYLHSLPNGAYPMSVALYSIYMLVVQLLKFCLTLWDPMDCSTPGFLVLHYLPKFAQTHVHWVDDAIQPSHPLLPCSPPAFSLSQHQWVHLVA